MRRVIKRGGGIALSVWAALQVNPYFEALVEAVSQHLGAQTASGVAAAFALSDANAVRSLLVQAGFDKFETTQARLGLDLPEPEQFVPGT